VLTNIVAMSNEEFILAALILVLALLYSSVGHGGASGYLAAMALMGVSPAMMRPTALTLNILVSVIATVKFYRAGAFSWTLFWPVAIASVPCAYLGGTMLLPGHIYKPMVGAVLLFAAYHAFHTSTRAVPVSASHPPLPILLLAGGVLGFFSGLTGIGGGVFLSPLLLYFRWAEVRVISGIAAAFILVNSIAGLLGSTSSAYQLPSALPYWATMAMIGATVGAEYGSKRLSSPAIKRLLALILLIAGVKMILTA